jgi:uracil-DNA glycosylase
MGFFDKEQQAGAASAATELKGHSLDFLHKHQCHVCPLNEYNKELQHPQMAPTGSKKPLVYIMGEAPDKREDRMGEQFVGRPGELLRELIPADWLRDIRWNNTVRCRPPEDRTPTMVEIECCRPSVVADIDATKPDAILGFGAVPLDWATGESRITNWAGRRVPVKIGSHSCWFYPMIHPSYVMRDVDKKDKDQKDWDLAFRMHLKRALKEIGAGLPQAKVWTPEQVLDRIYLETTLDGVLQSIERMYDEKAVGFDYETTCLRPYEDDARILTAGMAGADHAFAFPLRHRQAKWTQKELGIIEDALADFFVNAPCKKISHRLAFEAEWTAYTYGWDAVLQGRWEDTESQAFILDERPHCHSLDFLAMQYLGLRIKGLTNLNRKNLDNVDLPLVLRYNGADAKVHRLLHLAQMPRIKEEGLSTVYEQHLPRVTAMVLTQIKGVPVDQKVVAAFTEEYEGKLKATERKIAKLEIAERYEHRFGEKFEPSNNNHVFAAFTKLEKLKLEKVDEKVLSKVKHPLAKLVLEWRKDAKLLSTYIKPVQPDSPNVYPDGKLHPIINTTRTRTSRTASEDPNIQNWPKRGPGKIIRKQVRHRNPEIKVVAFDYAGIQARNVAMESGDKGLVKHYWEHYDIHSDWLERLCRVVPGWATGDQLADKKEQKELRNVVKNKFVFPSFFGAQPRSIANDLKIDERDAEDYQAEFFDEFPDVKAWHERLVASYHKLGYVTGLSQFRRRAPVDHNQIINSPIQADEALIVCNAMASLTWLGDPKFQPNFMIHDDLTFFWRKADIEKNAETVLDHMLKIEYPWINVPIEVEMSIGEDWYSLDEVGKFEAVPGKKGWVQR